MYELELEATVEVVVTGNPEIAEKAKNDDDSAITSLTNKVKNATVYNHTESSIEEELNKKLSEEYYKVPKIAGLPVVKDGERLAFQNPKTNSIHVASETPSEDEDSRLSSTYTWSACNFGSARGKSKENSLYLSEEELTDDYIERDGEIIGKLCGNCKQQF